ncbi:MULTISPECIES: hypothetical protein [unclassified Flavobacterium]|uniref:hypothetical protein n=1 Tax=unclassified Flavobacterium TaxID=196869 RepID=UPI0025C459AA|nr:MULTISPECIES: hypothetical protein [unclassified Flavobacterium]
MGILKYTTYLYLVICAFSIYKCIEVWDTGSDQRWLFLVLAVSCLFMFFFRRRFMARIEERNRRQ